MSPESFGFTLTVPADVRLLGLVRDVCRHVAGYARLSESAAGDLCDRVAETAAQVMAAEPPRPCPLEFRCEEGTLRVSVAGRVLSQSRS